MKLLISDANILIDLEEGQIINLIFQLADHEFLTPDILFEEELRDSHEGLLDRGLRLGELAPESMRYVTELTTRYPKPGRIDVFTIALAAQEGCPLLTGDRDLRAAAEQENIIVHGTIWLVEQLILRQLLSVDRARDAFDRMRRAHRRLPWTSVEQLLTRLTGVGSNANWG